MMKFLNNVFSAPKSAHDPFHGVDISCTKEHPKVAELRTEAKAKMKQWGRKSLIEGGSFSRNNDILNGNKH